MEKEKDRIAEVVRQLGEQYDRKLNELSATVGELRERGTRRVVERPFLALGVAFALGLSLGIALARSR